MIASVTDVVSLDTSGLELYRSLRRPVDHRKKGLFIVEGNKVVLRFLESCCEVCSILLSENWLARLRGKLEERPEPIAVYRAPEHLIASIVGFRYHQGIIAVGRVPAAPMLSDVCAVKPSGRLFVALDGLTSAENTGVIIRNCAACGVDAVISGETSSDPWLRRSVRNSMGALFQLPVVYSGNLTGTLAKLRDEYGFSLIAAHLRSDSIPLSTTDFTEDCCVILGHEDAGISAAVTEMCDTVMRIPMDGRAGSFNVACASAIILHEAFRQRKAKETS